MFRLMETMMRSQLFDARVPSMSVIGFLLLPVILISAAISLFWPYSRLPGVLIVMRLVGNTFVLLFSGYGVLASLEAGSASERLAWQLFYGFVLVLAVSSLLIGSMTLKKRIGIRTV